MEEERRRLLLELHRELDDERRAFAARKPAIFEEVRGKKKIEHFVGTVFEFADGPRNTPEMCALTVLHTVASIPTQKIRFLLSSISIVPRLFFV